MLGGVLKETLKDEIATAKRIAHYSYTLAATTRLEYKIIHALQSMSKEDARIDIQQSCREYSTKYRIAKEVHVHGSILKKIGEDRS